MDDALPKRRDADAPQWDMTDRPEMRGRREYADPGDMADWEERHMEEAKGRGRNMASVDHLVPHRRQGDGPSDLDFDDMHAGGRHVQDDRSRGLPNAGANMRGMRREFDDGQGAMPDLEDVPVGQAGSASSFSVNFRDGPVNDMQRPSSRGPGEQGSGLIPSGDDCFDSHLSEMPAERPRPKGRKKAPPPVDDCWAGQSLGDALAPKKVAPAPSTTASSTTAAGVAAARGADCSKTPQEIVTWVRSLPESHVPEKSREQLAALVEDGSMNGAAFSQYVQQVPPEICAPKHAMKLKAAWSNVLKEAEARQVALDNLNAAPKQKATMIVV